MRGGGEQAALLAAAAEALAEVDADRAGNLVVDAGRLATAIDDSYTRGLAGHAIAGALAALRRWDEAEREVGRLADVDDRAEARLGLVEALRTACELDRAERVARAMEDPRRRVQALAAVLKAPTGIDQQRADRLAGDVERLARAIDDPSDQAKAYLNLACTLASAPTFQATTPDDPLRARAHRVLGALLAGPSWSEALVPLARLQPSALEAIGRGLDQVSPA